MERAISMLPHGADTSREIPCDTVTGRGPFKQPIRKSVEIKFKSKSQLNIGNVREHVR